MQIPFDQINRFAKQQGTVDAHMDEMVRLTFSPEFIHIFNKKSGANIKTST